MIPVARVGKLFGAALSGGLSLTLYDTFPAEFDPAENPLFVEIDSLPVPLWCDRFERRGMAGAMSIRRFRHLAPRGGVGRPHIVHGRRRGVRRRILHGGSHRIRHRSGRIARHRHRLLRQRHESLVRDRFRRRRTTDPRRRGVHSPHRFRPPPNQDDPARRLGGVVTAIGAIPRRSGRTPPLSALVQQSGVDGEKVPAEYARDAQQQLRVEIFFLENLIDVRPVARQLFGEPRRAATLCGELVQYQISDMYFIFHSGSLGHKKVGADSYLLPLRYRQTPIHEKEARTTARAFAFLS